MNIKTNPTLFIVFITMILVSCKKEKTTESFIANNTSQDFTIYFVSSDQGHFIESNGEKLVHTGTAFDNKLTYPFVSDTVRIKLTDSDRILYFAKSDINEEYNIFDVYNWTYLTTSSFYSKATYTFTNSILSTMREY